MAAAAFAVCTKERMGESAANKLSNGIYALAYETNDSAALDLPSGLTSIYGNLIVFTGFPDLVTQICAIRDGVWVRTGILSQNPIFGYGWIKLS